MKRHPRTDHCGGSRPAEKSVSLDDDRLRTVSRRCDRSRAARIAASDDENVRYTHAERFRRSGERAWPEVAFESNCRPGKL
jgi:hypothetical protein